MSFRVGGVGDWLGGLEAEASEVVLSLLAFPVLDLG